METVIQPIRLIHWTKWFSSVIFEGNDKPIENECLIPEGYRVNMTFASSWCTITTNQSEVDTANAFIFHAADYSSMNVPKRTGSPWILYTLESPLTAPFRQDPVQMKAFDYLASYHQKSRYFFTYFSPMVMDVANRPLSKDFIRRKSKQAPILWVAKNCYASNGREHYIRELMKYINVDSYGDCLNTKPFPPNKSREQLMTEYKFYLAIENANCEDYVTEKLADTLKFSAVPIIDGPSSYNGYLPNQRSAIRMDAYPDPRDLARYIRFLDENDDAYLAYMRYRQDALIKSPSERMDPLFVALWSDQAAHDYRVSWCSICRHMATTSTSTKYNQDGSVLPTTKESDLLLVDQTCMDGGKWNYAAAGPPYESYSWTPTLKDEFAYEVIGQTNASAPKLSLNTSLNSPIHPIADPSQESSMYSSSSSPLQATWDPLQDVTLDSALDSTSPYPQPETRSIFPQYQLDMLLLVCVSFLVLLGAFWAVYRGSRKQSTYAKRTTPHF